MHRPFGAYIALAGNLAQSCLIKRGTTLEDMYNKARQNGRTCWFLSSNGSHYKLIQVVGRNTDLVHYTIKPLVPYKSAEPSADLDHLHHNHCAEKRL